MPLAVVIGGDPAFLLAAAAPLPPGGDVCAVAGLLRQKPLDVVACRGVDLIVPAEAEIVLEGYVDPAEPPVTAGPLCGPLGHATPSLSAPVMHVTAITQRANPIYTVMVPGRPPHEAVTVARAMQRAFLAAGPTGDAGVGRLRHAGVRRRARVGRRFRFARRTRAKAVVRLTRHGGCGR